MTGSDGSHNPFQLYDAGVAVTVPEVLGLWATAPGSPETGLAFDPAAAPPGSEPVWRTQLPPEPAQARKLLEDAAGGLAGLPDSLHQAEVRVLALAGRLATTPAFDLPGMVSPLPEKDLSLFLKQCQAVDREKSFDVGQEDAPAGDETVGPFRAAMARLERLLLYYAWVETLVGEELVGRTTVSWLGKMDTFWSGRCRGEQPALHQQNLELVLRSRQALLQVFTQTVRLAAKVGVLLALPGGAILAVPALWKFIHQVISEF